MINKGKFKEIIDLVYDLENLEAYSFVKYGAPDYVDISTWIIEGSDINLVPGFSYDKPIFEAYLKTPTEEEVDEFIEKLNNMKIKLEKARLDGEYK